MALLTAACADTRGPGAPSAPGSVARAPGDGVGHYKVGRPYMIKGKWYTPYVDYDYQETGLASWYGPGFHGRMTANGEIFDENDVTAAHTTLPLPSVVRVTNLDNGRAMIVRVNDRGPFVDGRILDVSRRTAQMLGFERDGLARVHVELIADDSKREMMIAKGELPREPGAPATMLAQAAPAAAAGQPAAVPAQPAAAAATQVAAASPEAPARLTPVMATPLDAPVAAAAAPAPTPPAPVAVEPARQLAAAAPVPEPAAVRPALRPPVAVPATPSRMAEAPAPAQRFALVSPAAASTAPAAIRPSVPPAPPPAAMPAPPMPATGIVVNTGTFSSAAAAERVRKRLAGFGQARVVSERQGVWRVSVGPLPSPSHAERVMEAAMTIAQEEARVAAR
ncbi:MAG: septal ring lytic transglycosylase RlpA family protein [Rhodospirillales bacterium]